MVASSPRKSHSESFVRQTRGPGLGTVPAHGPWLLQARGPQGTSRPPARTHALGPGTEKSGGGPSVLTTLPRSRSRAPTASRSPHFNQGPKVASPPRKSHSESFVHQIRAQPSARCPRTAPGGYKLAGPRGARRPPASTHAVGPGTGKRGGGKEPLPNRVRPASVRSSWSRHRLENPTAKALFARPGAQPSARCPRTAPGGYKLAGPRGARSPPAGTYVLGPGTGKSGGRPSALTTLPRSRSRVPAELRSPHFSQEPMVASPPRKSHSESFVHQTRAQPSARCPRTVPGGTSSWNFGAPDAHQRARML